MSVYPKEEPCICTPETGCGELGDLPEDFPCEPCKHRDSYDPCPVLGFMCGFGESECDCCTPEQKEATRQYYSHETPKK